MNENDINDINGINQRRDSNFEEEQENKFIEDSLLIEEFENIKENSHKLKQTYIIALDISKKMQQEISDEQQTVKTTEKLFALLKSQNLSEHQREIVKKFLYQSKNYDQYLLELILLRIYSQISNKDPIFIQYTLFFFNENTNLVIEFPNLCNLRDLKFIYKVIEKFYQLKNEGMKTGNEKYRNYKTLVEELRLYLQENELNFLKLEKKIEIITAGNPLPKNRKNYNLIRGFYKSFEQSKNLKISILNLLGNDPFHHFQKITEKYGGRYLERPSLAKLAIKIIENKLEEEMLYKKMKPDLKDVHYEYFKSKNKGILNNSEEEIEEYKVEDISKEEIEIYKMEEISEKDNLSEDIARKQIKDNNLIIDNNPIKFNQEFNQETIIQDPKLDAELSLEKKWEEINQKPNKTKQITTENPIQINIIREADDFLKDLVNQ